MPKQKPPVAVGNSDGRLLFWPLPAKGLGFAWHRHVTAVAQRLLPLATFAAVLKITRRFTGTPNRQIGLTVIIVIARARLIAWPGILLSTFFSTQSNTGQLFTLGWPSIANELLAH